MGGARRVVALLCWSVCSLSAPLETVVETFGVWIFGFGYRSGVLGFTAPRKTTMRHRSQSLGSVCQLHGSSSGMYSKLLLLLLHWKSNLSVARIVDCCSLLLLARATTKASREQRESSIPHTRAILMIVSLFGFMFVTNTLSAKDLGFQLVRSGACRKNQ